MTGVIAIRQWDVVSKSEDSVQEISFHFISLIDELVAFREVSKVIDEMPRFTGVAIGFNKLITIKYFF